MLDSNNPSLWPNWLSEYWESFIEFLSQFTNLKQEELEKIIDVCKKIESDEYPVRITWHPYITHLYETAELFILFFWEDVPKNKIIATLLHDDAEDISNWDIDTLNENYWIEVGFLIHILSESSELKNKSDRTLEYNTRFSSYDNLVTYIIEEYYFLFSKNLNVKQARKIAKDVMRIKISDRISNISSMPLEHFKERKVINKILETVKFYVPIVIEIFWKHSKIYEELKRAIFFAESSLIREKFDWKQLDDKYTDMLVR